MKSSKLVIAVAFLLIVVTIATLAFTADANPLNTSTYSDERTDSKFALNEQQGASEDEDEQNHSTQPLNTSELRAAEETNTVTQPNTPADNVPNENTQHSNTPASEVQQAPTRNLPPPPASHPQYADRSWPLSYIFGKLSELV